MPTRHGPRAAAALPGNAIEIEGLTKIYAGDKDTPPKTALKGIDLTIPRGAFFGLLGPNGAGKSTIINIMAGLVTKSLGRVRIWDYDIDTHHRAAKCAIGVVPQELNIDPFFTPKQILDIQSGLYGIRPSEYTTWEVLETMGLTEQAHCYTRWLSGGMRRRLLIGKAILHAPPVLVLDEPTAGVDVELRQHLWSWMKDANAKGTTILLTTHYLEEAEKLCDTIAIMDEGDVITCEPTGDLLRRIDSKEMIVTIADDIVLVPATLASFDVELTPPRRLHFRFQRSSTQMGQIIAAIQAAGLTIADLATTEGRLEDVFLELTRGRKQGAAGDAP
jgi:ABC-2 type transport system ATP-binding protein